MTKSQQHYRERLANPPPSPSYTEKTCHTCQELKPLSDFKVNVTCRDGYTRRCRKCIYEFSEKGSAKKYRAKNWAKIIYLKIKRQDPFSKGRTTWACEITEQDILDLFDKQNGKCYWLGIKLMPSDDARHPLKPSLDRLDCSKGYIPGNVVITCLFANLGRNNCDSTVFEKFINECLSASLLIIKTHPNLREKRTARPG